MKIYKKEYSNRINKIEIGNKYLYYKDIIHPDVLITLFKTEKPLCKFSGKITTNTQRPFFTFYSKIRNLYDIHEGDILIIRISKHNRLVQFISRVYKWGKVVIPNEFINILNINNHETIDIKIISKNSKIEITDEKLDLSQIRFFDTKVKTILRTPYFITLHSKQKISYTIPRFIKISSKIIELIFLIHGDGHYKSKLYFVNKSSELINFVLNQFEKFFMVPKISWRARILIHNLKNDSFARVYWTKKLNIGHSQFYNSSHSKLKTNKIGNLRIILDKTLISSIFQFVFSYIRCNLNQKKGLDALNGLLCAEGGAQKNGKGLHRITLSYNKNEKRMFKNVLIITKIFNLGNEVENRMYVIQGWNKLLKFFEIFISNNKIPFRFHTQRRNNAIEGFLNNSYTKTMMKYLSVLEKKNKSTLIELSSTMKLRKESILDTLRKKQYQDFINFDGIGVRGNPIKISITSKGKDFLELIKKLESLVG